jgi:hypothetical protein
VESWYDGEIRPGEDWDARITANLTSADLVLLLITEHYLSSPYCALECNRALERHATKQTTVVPIIARECEWQMAPFARLQVIPRGGKPLSGWPDRRSAWTEVVDELLKVLEQRNAGAV